MKALRITSWSLIAISLAFKLLHIPFAGPLIILGSFLLFIHAIIISIKNSDTNLPDTFFQLNISIWTIYFTFRLMYWPFAKILFSLCLCAALAYIILLSINKSRISFPQIILFSYFLCVGVLAYTQTYRIYYFFNLNTVLNKESNTINYQAWDKYSWFLYLGDEKQKALDANQQAQNAAKEVSKTNPEILESILLIQQHKQQIMEENWTNYNMPF